MNLDYDVIPSFYDLAPSTFIPFSDGGAWSNKQLRYGEVKRKIKPEDPESRSKLFFEYDVLVSHRENGTATHKIYHNCYLINPLAGLADRVSFTLREAKDSSSFIPDFGSRVLLMCLDGNETSAFILGGIRSPLDKDDSKKGHHLVFEFNGVLFEINDDGSWSVTNKGKTDLKGEADPKRDKAGAGTKVKVEANGNFEVTTPNKQSIKIDNKDNTIDIESSAEVTIKTSKANVKGGQVNLGLAPVFSNVKGEPLVAILTQIITQVAPTLPTPWQQAALLAVIPQLSILLSSTVKGSG